MSDSPRTSPREIKQHDESKLAIVWQDDHTSILEVRALRLACGCAHCIDEWTGEERLDPASVPEDVRPIKIEPVGRYAIQIEWSDGHGPGVYTVKR
mgnify:CR=1 FL=1